MNDQALEDTLRMTLERYAGGLIETLRRNLSLPELGYVHIPSASMVDASGISVVSYELADDEDRFIGNISIEKRRVEDNVLVRVIYEGAFPRRPIPSGEKYPADDKSRVTLIAQNTEQPFKTATAVCEGWVRDDDHLAIPLTRGVEKRIGSLRREPQKDEYEQPSSPGAYHVSDVQEERIVIEPARGPAKSKIDADDEREIERQKAEKLRKAQAAIDRQKEMEEYRRRRMEANLDATIDIGDDLPVRKR